MDAKSDVQRSLKSVGDPLVVLPEIKKGGPKEEDLEQRQTFRATSELLGREQIDLVGGILPQSAWN